MPNLASIVCRLIWIASLLIALIAHEETSRYRWWGYYLVGSLSLSVWYWPEISGWTDIYWPALLAITLLRVLASIEAFHFQTRDFRWWWELAAAVFLTAFWFVFLIDFAAGKIPPSNRDAAMRIIRYGKLWSGLALFVNGLLFVVIGGWRNRDEDRHAAVVTALCLFHVAVSIFFVTKPVTEPSPAWIDPAATLADSAVYLSWAFFVARPQSRQFSGRGYREPGRSAVCPRPTTEP